MYFQRFFRLSQPSYLVHLLPNVGRGPNVSTLSKSSLCFQIILWCEIRCVLLKPSPVLLHLSNVLQAFLTSLAAFPLGSSETRQLSAENNENIVLKLLECFETFLIRYVMHYELLRTSRIPWTALQRVSLHHRQCHLHYYSSTFQSFSYHFKTADDLFLALYSFLFSPPSNFLKSAEYIEHHIG